MAVVGAPSEVHVNLKPGDITDTRSWDMNITEFTLQVRGEELICSLASPEKARLSERSGLLVNISATRRFALLDPSQNHPTEPFLAAGHYVLSFDLPHHGERVKQYGEGLSGMSGALMAGDDPFEQFVDDGKAALDACLEKGIGPNGMIVAYGVSRAAYCCLRLAAADPRVRAIAGPSPVTDWALLTEFEEAFDQSKLEQIHIDNWADQLADRAVYLCIGSQDDRVGTDSCVQFAMKLFERQRQALGEGTLYNQLHVVDYPDHSPAASWRLDATDYLLRFAEGPA